MNARPTPPRTHTPRRFAHPNPLLTAHGAHTCDQQSQVLRDANVAGLRYERRRGGAR